MAPRFIQRLLLLCLLLVSAAFPARDYPPERPRVRQSFLGAFYFPTFGLFTDSGVGAYDNFLVRGRYINLFAKGPNLNFYYWFDHHIRDTAVFPGGLHEMDTLTIIPQSRTRGGGSIDFAPFRFFRLGTTLEYTHNRGALPYVAHEAYDYRRLSWALDAVFDSRYSEIENYYRGKVFVYPQSGTLINADLKHNWLYPEGPGEDRKYFQASAGTRLYFSFARMWTLNFSVLVESLLGGFGNPSQALTSRVIGAYEIPGDFTGDAAVELRFLTPKGIFWDSPPFWYIASFMFKFSPGFILGYNAGLTGSYRSRETVFQNSFYISPVLAMRINGDLKAVIRMDIALASSRVYKLIIAFNFGPRIYDKPFNIGRIRVE